MNEARAKAADVLIAGGGIGGLLVAWALRARGCRVIVADGHPAGAPAWPASVGLINPVRGRRCTLAWQAPVAFAQAGKTYTALEQETDLAPGSLFRPIDIIRLFASEDERSAFSRRKLEIEAAGFATSELTNTPRGLRAPNFGGVVVSGGACVDPMQVVEALRAQLAAAGACVPAPCPPTELEPTSDGIRWPAQHIEARTLVLAGGMADAEHALAPELPLRPVKGESLVVRAPDLDSTCAIVRGHHLAPLGNGLWLCGGTKEPASCERTPTPAARRELEAFLQANLAVSWTVDDHRVGIRATTPDLRPLLGPIADRRVQIFNGLGSQGFSHAPWLAELMADHLVLGRTLPAEVLPTRFRRPVLPTDRWHAVEVAKAEALCRVQPGDTVIDLTAGNGGDTAWLAAAVGPDGCVHAFDIQPAAIEATRHRLADVDAEAEVVLHGADHARFTDHLPATLRGRLGLTVANLGHLPGSTSGITTQAPSTLAAFSAALAWLRPGGALIAVVHPGQPAGKAETEALEVWTKGLSSRGIHASWLLNPRGVRRAPRVLVVETPAASFAG